MTGRTRSRLDRMRAAAGIAQLALQQIEDDLNADDVDAGELAGILRELQEDVDAPGGLHCVVQVADRRPHCARSRRPPLASTPRAAPPAWP
ncbi:hypothetical protein [Streptomyces sp. NPDC093260]|uniref:hypothetical protein n=1 Tax=Streptomyces sp. NPDC093260 TaxID=3155073 RepID=UPI003429D4A2